MSDTANGMEACEKVNDFTDEVSSTSQSEPIEAFEEARYDSQHAHEMDEFCGRSEIEILKEAASSSTEPLMTFASLSDPNAIEHTSPKIQTADRVSSSIPVDTRKGCCCMSNLDPRVLDLIYWRDVKKTGVVFGSMVFLILALTFFTILSVVAYLCIAVLTVTISYRVYRNVIQAIQKTNEGHPFRKLLEMDIELKEDVIQSAGEKISANINSCSHDLLRLFLVENYVDSLKFGLLMWLLTYIGCWFSGMTLVTLVVVAIFTLPKVYDTYKGPIDQNVNLMHGQINKIIEQISAKIPFLKKQKTQ